MRYLSIMTRWRRCKNVSDRVYYSFSVRSAGWNPQAVQLKILHHAPRFAGVLFFCIYPGEGVPISYTSTAGGSAGGVFFWWGVPWLGLPLWAVLVAWCVLWLFVLLCAFCLSFFGAFLSGCVLVWLGAFRAVCGWLWTLWETPPEGEAPPHFCAEGVLRVAEK